MRKYIEYAEYQQLGGTLDEPTFNYILPEAQIKIDYFTSNRLHDVTSIYDEVKLLVVRIIDFLGATKSCVNDSQVGLSSYSNGIESFGFNNASDTEEVKDNRIYRLVKEYLSDYPELLYRGVR